MEEDTQINSPTVMFRGTPCTFATKVSLSETVQINTNRALLD